MSAPKAQNHHFIPRFILRKFAPADQPPAGPAASANLTSRGRDFLVNKIDLESSGLTQRPVSTEFALVDMYRDPGFEESPYHLEKKLARLEGEASRIINRVAKPLVRAPHDILRLKRREVDTLRKFLFLMKYRNGGMFERYNHDDVENYDSDDRPRMLRYMAEKGFTIPRDVWFNNLRHMLDLEMDPQRNWRHTLQGQIYPDDAKMFELHLLHSYMTFCQPTKADEEFLLTENAFGIFEGPSSECHDILTGKKAVVYTEYHNFAPLTPRLLIILRSNLLPYPGDNRDSAETRGLLLEALKSSHLHSDQAGSLLEDLPVRPCKTIYQSKNVDSPASFNTEDECLFICFKLSTAHVSKLNNIFLEQAYQTSSIVYHSRTALRTAIETYFADDNSGMKHVIDIPGIEEDRRLLYMKKLQQVSRSLGGSTTYKIKSFGLLDAQMRIHMALNVGKLVGVEILRNQKPPMSLPREYTRLKRAGSGLKEFRYDLDQASRLVMLKTKLDGALGRCRLTEAEKATVRAQVNKFINTFPIERLWFYFKILRNLKHCDVDDIWAQKLNLEIDGPEDKFV